MCQLEQPIAIDCPHTNFTFADIDMYSTPDGSKAKIIPPAQFLLCTTCHQAVPNPNAIETFTRLAHNVRQAIALYFEEKGWAVDFLRP